MISKERLEELIKQCATIYSIEYDKIEVYDLSDEDICMSPSNFRDYGLRIFNPLGYWNDVKFENLFETKEEAEWHKEFGNITRTERLELPTWEEFLKLDEIYSFRTKYGKAAVMFSDNNTLFVEDEEWNILRQPLTKENYTLACRKCKELFIGGDNENNR